MTVTDVTEVSETLEQFSIDGLIVTRLGLELPENLPYEQWELIGRRLRAVERAIQWLIGDWLQYGERTYGEMYAQALDATEYSYGTLRNQAYVASRFELSRRHDNLSFSHHQEVASLPPEEADELLARADPTTNESGDPMPVSGFRQMVRHHQERRGRRTVDGTPLSVTESDAQALVSLIGIHSQPDPAILDVTHNYGEMWVGTAFAPHRMDVNPTFRDMGLIETVADCRAMPFDDETWDVVVFDPPHITDAGEDSLMGQRYGSLEGANISSLFEPFLTEARRVLKPNGVVLAKICDVIHGGRRQWQQMLLIQAAEDLGFTACDLMVKVNSREPVEGSSWQTVRHVRNAHAYWIVLRKGADNCDRGGYVVAQP